MTHDATDAREELRRNLLHAALPHVPFDGWSDKTLLQAATDLRVSPDTARLMFPGGGVEMIALFSRLADEAMAAALADQPLSDLKVRERVILAVRTRIEANAAHREAARRAMTLLALPQNAATGMKLACDTADAIWRAVGDTSLDYNYYTKRLILAGVWSATVLYWLGDDSEGFADTWGFLERRVDDVVSLEKAKAKMSKAGDAARSMTRFMGRLRYGS
jgi:ubiquinone biosynthesis protein COQ9